MNQAPLVRLILPFIIGIIAAIYLPVKSLALSFILFILFIGISIVVLNGSIRINYKKRWVFGLIINLFLFFSAYQLTILKTEKFNSDHFSKYLSNGPAYVRVLQPYLEKEKILRAPAEVLAVYDQGKMKCTNGKLMLYIAKDSSSMRIRYGDCLFINANCNEIQPPKNPSEFDYKKYLAFHNIFHQAYVPAGAWKFSGINEGNFLLKNSIILRDKLLQVFKNNKVKGDEYAVGSALLLGYEDKLDADIISAYSGTGALHVLSVSGMHVAIVYIVFFYILFFLDRFKYGNIIKAVCLLLFLWFYAALTGLSPSVLRAAAMFSFVIIGKAFKFQSNIYNTLAASAFLLLIINPYLIMEVGFQLSYLAVVGIVFIHPIIYEKWETGNLLLEKIWAIISVSIAAQLATFPLGLHYFHQFPNYFLFSNLLVIPLSSLIIYIGILLLSVSNFTGISLFTGKLFSMLIEWLNDSVKLIEHLPYALVEGISISIFETWMIYFAIAFMFAFFLLKKNKYLILTLFLIVGILSFQVFEKLLQDRQEKFIVYDIPGNSAYDFICGRSNLLLGDSSLLKNDAALLFHVKHNWWENGVSQNFLKALDPEEKSNLAKAFSKVTLFQNEKVKVGVINKTSNLKGKIKKRVNVDYLIIADNQWKGISLINSAFNFKKLIFDSSNSIWKIKKWKRECLGSGIDSYSVPDQGAFIATIQ